MFAIIKDGGKQYRVEEGQTVLLDLREGEPGDKLELSEVLCIEDGEEIKIGQPVVEGARVIAEIVAAEKGPKLIFHRFRRRKGSRTRTGHRQKYIRVRIDSIVS